jgi:hypothetical protein
MVSDLRERRRAIEQARAVGPARAERGVVDPVVRASWQRSKDIVDASLESAPVESAGETERRWQDSVIRRVVPGLVDQLEQAATTSDLIALISDPDGRVIWQSTPLWLRRGAARIGLIPGGNWGEPVMGTNGIGLSLAADRPTAVFSAEHWTDPVHEWVCYGAPVRGPDGVQVGALNLSTSWKNAHPLALATVSAMAQVVEHELRAHRTLLPGCASPVLEVRVLGEPRATLDGAPLRLTHRQFEIITILAVTGGSTLGELHALLYGDRPVAPTTLKAEISHLRRQLDGHLASRPYRLELPVRVDAVDLPRRLETGDVESAARLYAGQLLPASEAPFVLELRHEIDVALRTALLRDGTAPAALSYSAVHPYDVEVLERVGDVVPLDDPLLPALTARLAVARAS